MSAGSNMKIRGISMKSLFLATSALVLSGLPAFADGHATPTSGYALAGDGSTLLVMADLSDPGAVAAYELSTAINSETDSEAFQYAFDAETNALVSLAKNAGTLATIAPVTVDGDAVDLAAMGGFDIVSGAEG